MDPYNTQFASLRTNATSLLGQAMVIDCLSPWKSELVQRCQDLLKAIDYVESHNVSLIIDEEKKSRGE